MGEFFAVGKFILGSSEESRQDKIGGELWMNLEAEESERSLPIPPSYEQCVVDVSGTRADFVASPLAMAALFDWEDDD